MTQIDDILLAVAALLTAIGGPAIWQTWVKARAERRADQEETRAALAELRALSASTNHEVKPNSGGSLRDAVARIEDRLDAQCRELKAQGAELTRQGQAQDDMVERIHELRRDVADVGQASRERANALHRLIEVHHPPTTERTRKWPYASSLTRTRRRSGPC